MVIQATEQDLLKLKLNPANKTEAIGQNIAILMMTPKGNVPLGRNMGMSMRYKDRTMKVARAMFEAELTENIDEYEPRAQIKSITVEMDEFAGRMSPTVEVEINGR